MSEQVKTLSVEFNVLYAVEQLMLNSAIIREAHSHALHHQRAPIELRWFESPLLCLAHGYLVITHTTAFRAKVSHRGISKSQR
eukprot:6129114-Amphidinium_carterae.1